MERHWNDTVWGWSCGSEHTVWHVAHLPGRCLSKKDFSGSNFRLSWVKRAVTAVCIFQSTVQSAQWNFHFGFFQLPIFHVFNFYYFDFSAESYHLFTPNVCDFFLTLKHTYNTLDKFLFQNSTFWIISGLLLPPFLPPDLGSHFSASLHIQ